MFREWVVAEKRAAVDQTKRLAEQAEDLAALRAKLEGLISDPSFARVRDNYGYEAAREALDERRRMLAFASAGSVNLKLTIAQLARVERTIRDLDPEDIRLLARVAMLADPPPPEAGPGVGVKEAQTTWFQHMAGAAHVRALVVLGEGASGEVLIASGCVQISNVKPEFGIATPVEGASITHAGQWVLAVLDGYIRANQP
jgi:hypothetical protein